MKPFMSVRKRVESPEHTAWGPKRVACSKCGRKCRYLADISGDLVCKECYEDFAKHFGSKG